MAEGEQGPAPLQQVNTLRIAVVAGVWHAAISNGLIAGASAALEESGCRFEIVRVPSSFDIPVVAQALLETSWDAVVAVGVIVRGATSHFEHLSHAVTSGLSNVAIQVRKPIGFGILIVDTERQGLERAGLPDSKEDKGREAADWALGTALLLRQLRQETSRTH